MKISRAGSAFARFYETTRNDIFKFAKAFRFEPTDQQSELFKDVQELAVSGHPTHIACKSGQGPGKTTAAALIGLWRTFRSFMALTVVTAPTMRQCKEVWLGEARKHVSRAYPEVKNWFEVRATEIEILGMEDWGIKLASASKPENMAGWHNPHLSIIVDEASGVSREIIETILGTVTNKDKMVFLISNPTLRDSYFFDCFGKERGRWATHTFNSEDSPIVDQENVERLADLYGKDSDVYRVRVLGEFPLSDPNCVMSSDDLEACALNDLFECARRKGPGLVSRQFGVDFARYGDDSSVIYRRSGLAIVEQKMFSKTEPDVVVASAFEMQRNAQWRDNDCWYVPDAGGMGQGVMHHFHNRNKQVHEFHFGGSANESSQYHDRVTEAFFRMAELVKKRKIYIPDDSDLIAELSSRQYHMTLKNKIKVDSKEDWRKMTQRGSPDRADCAVMAYYPHLGEGVRILTGAS